MLKHGQIPASLHFETPNPHIDFAALKLRVPDCAGSLSRRPSGARMAGVNSFGFGGANSHVILAEPPPRPADTVAWLYDSGRAWPLMLSARSEGALRASASRLSEWLEAKEKSNGGHRCCLISLTRSGAGAIITRIGSPLSRTRSAEVIQELDGLRV